MTEVTENTVAEKKSRQVITGTDRLFYTGKPVRHHTVFHFIVEKVVEQPGITAEELKEIMLADFTPQKSETFGAGYCQAYIRGSVKEGYCHTDEDLGAEADAIVEPAPVQRAAPGEGAGSGITPASQGILDALEATEDKSATLNELVSSMDKPKRNLSTTIRAMEKRGLVTVAEVLDETGEKVVDKKITVVSQ